MDEFPNRQDTRLCGNGRNPAIEKDKPERRNAGHRTASREYSEQEQKDILNNENQNILPGFKRESGEYVSNLSGYSTIKKNDMEQRVELLSAAELRTIPDGKILAMLRNYPQYYSIPCSTRPCYNFWPHKTHDNINYNAFRREVGFIFYFQLII